MEDLGSGQHSGKGERRLLGFQFEICFKTGGTDRTALLVISCLHYKSQQIYGGINFDAIFMTTTFFLGA